MVQMVSYGKKSSNNNKISIQTKQSKCTRTYGQIVVDNTCQTTLTKLIKKIIENIQKLHKKLCKKFAVQSRILLIFYFFFQYRSCKFFFSF